jgi:hypothetical protein
MSIRREMIHKGTIHFVYVDDEFWELMEDESWRIVGHGKSLYVKSGKGKFLHRVIMNPPRRKCIDHINGNGLDNRRSNMRICKPIENMWNSRKKEGTVSKYKGVRKNKDKWRASITANGVCMHLGMFTSEIRAAKAYNAAAAKHFGEYACLNPV